VKHWILIDVQETEKERKGGSRREIQREDIKTNSEKCERRYLKLKEGMPKE